MHLAHAQTRVTVSLWCQPEDLAFLPTPQRITDMQTGELLVELRRDILTLVALRLCGVEVDISGRD